MVHGDLLKTVLSFTCSGKITFWDGDNMEVSNNAGDDMLLVDRASQRPLK